MAQPFLNASRARLAANIATVLFAVVALLQLLLAAGVIPVTAAWGGTQPVLTTSLRLASIAAAGLLLVFAYIIRRRAGLAGRGRPSLAVRILSWLITIFLALNTLGNFASPSSAERFLFGPLTLLLVLACLVVSSSRLD
jgi:hypothetical protein